MSRCLPDPSVSRVKIGAFEFPLGVYPIEAMEPAEGYTVEFEPADGDNEDGEWEEWPDRYAYDIVVSAARIEPLWRQLLTLLPGRVYPILDYLGRDAYREVDPYISYELIGAEHVIDGVRRYRGFFFEDGMVGFGAACDDPFVYVFLDEHKIFTVRVPTERREELDSLLEAFDLKQMDEACGADSAAHEHRSVLLTPPDRPELLGGDEIVERLREEWRLVLNVDPEVNVDDEGNELGRTGWRCVVRAASEKHPQDRYAEVVVAAGCLGDAEEAAGAAGEALIGEDQGEWLDLSVVTADRLTPEGLGELIGKSKVEKALRVEPEDGEGVAQAEVLEARWLPEE